MNKLLCGAAKGDITPNEKLFPMPLLGPLKINTINDRIHARVLAFQYDDRKSLLIALDMTLVPHSDDLLTFISDEFGIERKNILICATHTHEVTPISLAHIYPPDPEDTAKCDDWYQSIKQTLHSTVESALSALRPCKIGYREGKSYINCNRDEIKTDKAELGFNFERPSDKKLKLIRIEDENDKIIAFLVNYACHAVVMNGCIVAGGIGLSGDLPGRTSSQIENIYPGSVCLWTSGAAGDQNPRMTTNFGMKNVDGKLVYQNLGETGYMVLDMLVDEHVRDILKTNKGITCEKTDGEIRCRQTICKCPKREDDGEIEYLLSVLWIGNLVFEGIDGEVPTSIGESTVRVSPNEKTLLVTHANGYKGYIPDDWQIEHNSFEAEGAFIKKGCVETLFVKSFWEMFRLFDKE